MIVPKCYKDYNNIGNFNIYILLENGQIFVSHKFDFKRNLNKLIILKLNNTEDYFVHNFIEGENGNFLIIMKDSEKKCLSCVKIENDSQITNLNLNIISLNHSQLYTNKKGLYYTCLEKIENNSNNMVIYQADWINPLESQVYKIFANKIEIFASSNGIIIKSNNNINLEETNKNDVITNALNNKDIIFESSVSKHNQTFFIFKKEITHKYSKLKLIKKVLTLKIHLSSLNSLSLLFQKNLNKN